MPQKIGKRYLPFGQRLFISVVFLFFAFVTLFVVFQFQREKAYKIELMHSKLQDYNDILNAKFINGSLSRESINQQIKLLGVDKLRVSIINFNGDVLFDNMEGDSATIGNHLNRKEVAEAITHGSGYDVRRTSETTGVTYFYSATMYNDYIIRSAIPYGSPMSKNLKIDATYIWFSVIIALLLIAIFYRYTYNLGISINQLKEFTRRIDKDEPVDEILEADTPKDELGEISQHIFYIYKQLHETKDELYLEREKLIAHLHSSKEGLGVFTENRKELLTNNLFIQYINIISDHNLEKPEEVFDVPEFQAVTNFIGKAQTRSMMGKDEKRISFNINKNARIFTVAAIIFQDMSFEISINDVTLDEEQTQLKRQLTQNIAHELKTPVSSIQAYLETIVTNKDIDPEKAESFLQRCYEQSNRLVRLLRDISVLTRMDEAAGMLEIEKVDINTLVENVIDEVNIDLEKKNIIVDNQLKENIRLRGNTSLIYSIFRNLMDNAIAYAGRDIRITINCFREDENFYYFSFADTGIGVGPEHMHRLFERFYRVDKGRSRKLGGTGLGLAIVKNAVIIHGGSISAKNNPGGGLEFIFTLAKDR